MLSARTPLALFLPLLLGGTLAAQDSRPATVRFSGSPGKASGGAEFVDYSKDLGLVTVSAVFGQLDKFRDGRRKRIKDKDAHVGAHGSVSRVSGTQYYRVQSKTHLLVAAELGGKQLEKKKVPLVFDVQLARMPDGTETRQILGSTRESLETGVDYLFVVQKDTKKKSYRILHAIERPKDQKPESFRKDAEDIAAINRRIVELRDALASAKQLREKDPEVAVGTLEKAVADDRKVELREPENDQLVRRHVEPWVQRVRDLVAEIRKRLGAPPRKG